MSPTDSPAPEVRPAPEPDPTDAATPWSRGVRRAPGGALTLAGHELPDLAGTHGTPVYLLDVADLQARAREYVTAFHEAFADLAGAEVYYAGKAFLSVAVARWVHTEGMSIDVASGTELATALRAGVPGERIALHGNNKSDAELTEAVHAGVGRIVIDSLTEIERLAHIAAAHNREVGVMVRVTTGVHAGGHDFIATAHEDQKFGLSLRDGAALQAVRDILGHPQLRLRGLHSHIGSQIMDLSGFRVAARALLELRAHVAAEHGVLMPELDLGGGYGISYTGEQAPPRPHDIATTLAQAIADTCAQLDTPVPHISVEPGRSIIGPAGLTLYRVGTVKPVTLDEGGQRLYVSVDGGMSDNIRTALYDAHYTAALANRQSEAPLVTARVVGMHCESGDIVVRDVALPSDIRAGDLLAVPATGAYGRAMASNYNMVPRPGVLAVTENDTRFIIRPETRDDVMALDMG